MTNRKKVHEVRLKWFGAEEVLFSAFGPAPAMMGLIEVKEGRKPVWEDRLATAGKTWGCEPGANAYFRVWDDPELLGVRLQLQYQELKGTVLDAIRAASEAIAQQFRDAGYEVRIEETEK